MLFNVIQYITLHLARRQETSSTIISEMFPLALSSFPTFFWGRKLWSTLAISQMYRTRWVPFPCDPGANRRAYFGNLPDRSGFDRVIARHLVPENTTIAIHHKPIRSIQDARRASEEPPDEFSSRVSGQSSAHLENFQTLSQERESHRNLKIFPRRNYRWNCRIYVQI